MKVKFPRDTKLRKELFTPESFKHPAKLDVSLCLWLTERYTKPGDTILDPMAGTGTQMVACTMGRNVILAELEQKFVDMAEANWEKVKTRPRIGSPMGECKILKGDSRKLKDVLADVVITSPPYAESVQSSRHSDSGPEQRKDRLVKAGYNPDDYQLGVGRNCQVVWEYGKGKENIGNLKYGDVDAIVTSPPYAEAHEKKIGGVTDKNRGDLIGYSWVKSDDPDNVSSLKYGEVADAIITSPSYEGLDPSQSHMTSNKRGDPADPNYRPSWKGKLDRGYARTKRPYHSIDAVVTSPPYEEALGQKHHSPRADELARDKANPTTYTLSGDGKNIGNLRGQTYLQAMATIYAQCLKILKPGGLMILITKNFIRKRKVVRLDLDTIKLCESVGFRLLERHERKLPSQSFWRVLYHQKNPTVPMIEHEDVLVFRKGCE